MKKIVSVAFILAFLMISTGCMPYFVRPILWYGPAFTWYTYDVSIDVGSNGAKHILYVNCALSGRCYLEYTKTFQGERTTDLVFTPEIDSAPSTPFFRFPDISVMADGTAYFVWHYQDHNGYFYDCWKYVDTAGTPTGGLCPKLQDEGQYSPSTSYPKVIAFDNVVYAVYEVADVGGPSLYYRQLNPLNASHGKVTGTAGGSSSNPSLAVSSYLDVAVTKYVLHVAWANNYGNVSSKTVYNDNYGLTGDMTTQIIFSDAGARSDPVIVTTNSTNKAYIVYRLDGTPDQLTLLYCDIPQCSIMIGVPDLLAGAGNWELVGRPDMTSDEDNVLISFTGMNDSTRATTGFQEIFAFSYSSGGSIPVSLTRITNNNAEEGDPRIVQVTSLPVIAWRDNSDSGYYRDAYVYNTVIGIRTVFISPDDVLGGYYDLAANGDYVGGVFIDQGGTLQTGHCPWITFNGTVVYFPAINKP